MCIYLNFDTDKSLYKQADRKKCIWLPAAHVGQVTFRKMETYCFIASWGLTLNPGPATFPTQTRGSEWMNGAVCEGYRQNAPWIIMSQRTCSRSFQQQSSIAWQKTTDVQTISGNFRIRSVWFFFCEEILGGLKSFPRWHYRDNLL